MKQDHSFTCKSKAFPWPWCSHCGLIRLKNEETEKLLNLVVIGKN